MVKQNGTLAKSGRQTEGGGSGLTVPGLAWELYRDALAKHTKTVALVLLAIIASWLAPDGHQVTFAWGLSAAHWLYAASLIFAVFALFACYIESDFRQIHPRICIVIVIAVIVLAGLCYLASVYSGISRPVLVSFSIVFWALCLVLALIALLISLIDSKEKKAASGETEGLYLADFSFADIEPSHWYAFLSLEGGNQIAKSGILRVKDDKTKIHHLDNIRDVLAALSGGEYQGKSVIGGAMEVKTFEQETARVFEHIKCVVRLHSKDDNRDSKNTGSMRIYICNSVPVGRQNSLLKRLKKQFGAIHVTVEKTGFQFNNALQT